MALDKPTRSRRDVVKTTAGLSGVGLAALAGCLGNGDDDDVGDGDDGDGDDDADVELVAGCSSRGTTSFNSCQAMQAAADSHSDMLAFTATAPGGDPAALREVALGETDIATSGNYIAAQAAEDQEMFEEEPLDYMPPTVMSFTTIEMYWLQKADAGYDSLDDAIEQEADMYGFPAGWGLRQLLENILEEGGRLDDIAPLLVNEPVEEVAGALEEDRIEVFAAYGSGGANVAGWVLEVDSRVDCELIEVEDWFWDAVEESPALFEQFEPYGWEQDLNWEGELNSWVDGFNMYAGDHVDDDAVYELCRVANEHIDTIQDAEAAFLDTSDLETMTSTFWGHDVHPGAEQFYEDNDHSW